MLIENKGDVRSSGHSVHLFTRQDPLNINLLGCARKLQDSRISSLLLSIHFNTRVTAGRGGGGSTLVRAAGGVLAFCFLNNISRIRIQASVPLNNYSVLKVCWEDKKCSAMVRIQVTSVMFPCFHATPQLCGACG